MRTCIACRAKSPKKEMLRFVLKSDGKPMLDESGKISGRGANTCASNECFEQAVEKNAFARAWSSPVSKDVWGEIRGEVDKTMKGRAFRKGEKHVTIRVKKDEAESKVGKPLTRELAGDE